MLRIYLLFSVIFVCLFSIGCEGRNHDPPIVPEKKRSNNAPPPEREKVAIDAKESFVNKNSAALEPNKPILPSASKSHDVKEIVEEAKVFFDKLVLEYPSDFDAFDSRARYYFLIGDHDVARECWNEAVRLNANDSSSHNGLGLLYQANNDFESALSSFQMALKHKPNDPTLKIGIAKSLIQLGRLEESIQVVRECTESHPDSTEAWELLGKCYMANQDYEHANQAYTEAVRRAPQSFQAQQGMSATLIRLNRRDEAAKWLELQKGSRTKLKAEQSQNPVAELRNISQHLGFAANVFLRHQRSELAIVTLRYAISCAPNEDSPKQTLIDLYQKLGKVDEAIEVAKKLVQQSPERMGFRFGLADLYARKKNWNMVEQTLDEAIEADPKNPQGFYLLAKLLLSNGDSKSRLLQLTQKLVALRGSAADFVLLAQSHHAKGDVSNAISALKTAIQKDPDNSAYRSILSQLESGRSKP